MKYIFLNVSKYQNNYGREKKIHNFFNSSPKIYLDFYRNFLFICWVIFLLFPYLFLAWFFFLQIFAKIFFGLFCHFLNYPAIYLIFLPIFSPNISRHFLKVFTPIFCLRIPHYFAKPQIVLPFFALSRQFFFKYFPQFFLNFPSI